MDHSRSLLLHILRLVCRRPHPRKEKVTKGSSTAIIPSCTLPLSFSLFATLLGIKERRKNTNTNMPDSSSSRTKNGDASAKCPRTTSPFTRRKTHMRRQTVAQTLPTHSARTAHGRNPRHSIKTTMRHPSTSRRRAPQRQAPPPERAARQMPWKWASIVLVPLRQRRLVPSRAASWAQNSRASRDMCLHSLCRRDRLRPRLWVCLVGLGGK